jgi:hypothetical protein
MSENDASDKRAARQRAEGKPGDEIRFRDAAPALEFMCWTVLALAPFLRWVNGPAVSTDQFVTHITVLTIALTGAIALRIYNRRKGRVSAVPTDTDSRTRR